MTTSTGRFLKLTWLFNRQVGLNLLWALLVAGIAVGVNVTGIHLIGSIGGWEHWMRTHAGYFFTWRLLLYGATAYGWWRMRRRLRQYEPGSETQNRLRRTEVAALLSVVLLEASQWLR